MNDLELTKKCAEGMGIVHIVVPRAAYSNTPGFENEEFIGINQSPDGTAQSRYQPLHDDAQAMALVKKFELDILIAAEGGRWLASGWVGDHDICGADNTDLNRAIVECVAKMTDTGTEPSPT